MEVKKQYAYFSAAIRDGAKLRPQGRGNSNVWVNKQTSCALEAGIEALGADFDWGDEDALFAIFPYLATEVKAPNRGGLDRLFEHCWKLNDEGWTREAVADWLYAEEEKLGFVTVVETEALKPQVGFINNVAEAQAGVLTK